MISSPARKATWPGRSGPWKAAPPAPIGAACLRARSKAPWPFALCHLPSSWACRRRASAPGSSGGRCAGRPRWYSKLLLQLARLPLPPWLPQPPWKVGPARSPDSTKLLGQGLLTTAGCPNSKPPNQKKLAHTGKLRRLAPNQLSLPPSWRLQEAPRLTKVSAREHGTRGCRCRQRRAHTTGSEGS